VLRVRSVVVSVVGIALLACAGIVVTGPALAITQPAAVVEPARGALPSDVFAGGLFVDPLSTASKEQARLAAAGDRSSAALVEQISSQPTAIWLGDWLTPSQLTAKASAALAEARASHTTATFVTYAIPGRDCGGYSAGGLTDAGYLPWNASVARALRGSHSVVIVEPDAVAMLTSPACAPYVSTRTGLLRSAVATLAVNGLTVYLDAGNSRWASPETLAPILLASGVRLGRGIATNVANYNSTSDEIAFAERISTLVGSTHYVIDTSRNGADRDDVAGWCNPVGAALGRNPAVADGHTGLDALLWIKPPGASDGTCNGGPAAGSWWLGSALSLVRGRTV
jgi:endoglucanase